ncbi:MAG: zinc ribbon domain-containing protein [Candidatus Heimdallarchaeota archaeon]
MQSYPEPRASPMQEIPVERPRGVFEIVSEAFSLYGRGFVNLWVPFLVVSIIVAVISFMISTAIGDIATDTDWENDEEVAEAVMAFVVLGIATFIIALAGDALATGMVVFTVRDLAAMKEPAPLGQVFEKVQSKLGALIGGTILFVLILIGAIAGPIIASIFLVLATGTFIWVFFGLLAGILLGAFCFTWFYIWAVCVVLEDQGVSDSFRRSKYLVKGEGWHVFGLIIISFIIVGFLASIMSLFSGIIVFVVFPDGGIVSAVVSSAVTSIVSPLAGIMTTLLYFDLKARKEMGPARWAPAMAPAPAPYASTAPAYGAPSTFCSACGAPLAPGTSFCSNCGSKAPVAPAVPAAPPPAAAPSAGFCSECGTHLPPGVSVTFCPNCGAKIQ